MKDFDVARAERLQRERSFRIGGETFVYRASVRPEALLAWDQRAEAQGQAFLDVIDETVVAFLEPGQEPTWRAVRAAEVANPVNIDDIVSLIQWLFEEQTGRHPTGPPSDSTNGHVTTETASTVVSSLPVTQPA